MLSRADLDALSGISQRAQIAYALSCIEAALRAYDLRGAAFDEWNERAWRRTSAPKSDWREPAWPRNFAEIDALLDPPAGGWGEGVSDVLRKIFELVANACEELLERGNAAPTLRALVTELARHGIDAPAIEAFVRSPSSEMGGVGRSVPPAFFRLGVDRERFTESLIAGIRSADVHERRAAAFAAGHLGVGSADLVEAMGDAMFFEDRDLALLAENALQSLVAPTEFTEILRRKKGDKMVADARRLMSSERSEDRARGARDAGKAGFLDASLLDDLRVLAFHDPDDGVRIAAAGSILNPSSAWLPVRIDERGIDDLAGLFFSPLRQIRRLVCLYRGRNVISALLRGISHGHGGIDPLRRAGGILEIEVCDDRPHHMRTVIVALADFLVSERDEVCVLWAVLRHCRSVQARLIECLSELSRAKPDLAAAVGEAQHRLQHMYSSAE